MRRSDYEKLKALIAQDRKLARIQRRKKPTDELLTEREKIAEQIQPLREALFSELGRVDDWLAVSAARWYFNGLTMEEIGELYGYTKAPISARLKEIERILVEP